MPACPVCERKLEWSLIYAGPTVFCPGCSSEIGVSRLFFRGIGLVSLVLSVFLAYSAGIRDELLFVSAVAIAFLPINWIVLIAVSILSPPELVRKGHSHTSIIWR